MDNGASGLSYASREVLPTGSELYTTQRADVIPACGLTPTFRVLAVCVSTSNVQFHLALQLILKKNIGLPFVVLTLAVPIVAWRARWLF